MRGPNGHTALWCCEHWHHLASLTGRTLLAWEPWQSLASPAVLAPAGLLLTAGLQVALEMQISLGHRHLCGTVTTCHHRARCRAEVHVLLCRLRRKRCLRHPGIAPAQSIPKSSQAADILLAACTRKILTQGTFAFSSSSSSSSVNGRSAVNTKPVALPTRARKLTFLHPCLHMLNGILH